MPVMMKMMDCRTTLFILKVRRRVIFFRLDLNSDDFEEMSSNSLSSLTTLPTYIHILAIEYTMRCFNTFNACSSQTPTDGPEMNSVIV